MLKVKIFVGVSLLLFVVTCVSLFTAAIINYQTEKTAGVIQSQPGISNRLASLDQQIGGGLQKSPGIDLTIDEVAKHNSENDCWLLIGNKVYDVTSYLTSHPGGKPIIVKYCGKDGTAGFSSKDKVKAVDHSKMAHDLLGQYLVGELGQTLAGVPADGVVPTIFVNIKPTVPVTTSQNTNTNTNTNVNTGIGLTAAEVASHNTLQNCWLIISGKVYDVTSYISQHPGGSQMILNSCGKDGTTAYATKGGGGNNHSGYASGLLGNYLIGNFGTSVAVNPTAVPTNAPITGVNPTSVPGIQPTSVPVTSNLTLTAAEVASHNTLQNCWLIISGKVYDVTSYISQHPGGVAMITNQCGKDGTTAFQTKGGGGGNHSGNAYNLLNNYLIGTLGSSVPVNPTSTPGAGGTNPTATPGTGGCNSNNNLPISVQTKYPCATVTKISDEDDGRMEIKLIYNGSCRSIKTNSSGAITEDKSC